MMSCLRRFVIYTIAVIAVASFFSPSAFAQQLESANFTISNDELMGGALEGNSSNFTMFGENSSLVGSSESSNFSLDGVVLGQAIPRTTPSSSSDSSSGSSSSSSSSSTTTTSPPPTPGPFTGFFQRFFPEELPSQLFDISLEIDDSVISDIKDLVARVLFTSFGVEPTPVDLTFTILNSIGEEVYRSRDSAIVETELVFNKYFTDIDAVFEDGKYTLVLKTLYNTDVEDEFRAEFTMGEEAGFNWKFFLSALLVGLGISVIIFLRKRSKESK